MKVIKIGVISDTHNLSSFNKALPQIKRIFSGCNYIIHAGDIIHPKVFSELTQIAPLKAILGNKRADLVNFPSLPRRITLKEGKFKIGVVHGLGNNPERIFNWVLGKIGLGRLGMKLYFKRIRRFFPKDIDCLIFGDLHLSINEWNNNKLFFNSGTTDESKNFPGSVGILKIRGNGLISKVIFL